MMQRRLPAGLQMAIDIVRFTIISRSGVMLLLLVAGILAIVAGAAVKVAVPWAIYPFV